MIHWGEQASNPCSWSHFEGLFVSCLPCNNFYTCLHLEACITPALTPTSRPGHVRAMPRVQFKMAGRRRIFRPGGLFFLTQKNVCHGKVKDIDGLHASSRYYGQDSFLRCFSETQQHFAFKKKINRIFYLHYKQNFSKNISWSRRILYVLWVFKKVDSRANQNSFYKREWRNSFMHALKSSQRSLSFIENSGIRSSQNKSRNPPRQLKG